MKRKLGLLLIVLGVGLIAGALGLFLRNQQEDLAAETASREAIVKVVEVIREHQTAPTVPAVPLPEPERTMTVSVIDGYGYIGFVSMPTLGLELPVMADWSYDQLKLTPCRYTGSVFTDDLVLMAHNYKKHFGPIRRLKTDDPVTFTDMDGSTYEYRVVAQEVLGSGAVEDVTAGEYDLTLFTCTYGGENRIVVRCDRIEN